MDKKEIVKKAKEIANEIKAMSVSDHVEMLNEVREILHSISLFKAEPVDCVKWVQTEDVRANDYNPNKVAPPEMKLLKKSVLEDGYTQPIVSWRKNGYYEVVDGFHRNRVGKEVPEIKERVRGFLPLSVINPSSESRGSRIAATIRHNRARGRHLVEGMSDIVVELKNRNWSNRRICKQLGMDEDEVLRLCQISGLSELFSDQEFSKSWDVEHAEADGSEQSHEFIPLTDDVEIIAKETEEHGFRIVNTGDRRIYHTHDKWECYKAGFYKTTKKGGTRDEWEKKYAKFLGDTEKFSDALSHVITEWKFSCEHYLTNTAQNRIAWLGQAACCYALGIPHVYRGGFYLLSDKQQKKANETALIYLNKWLEANDREPVSLEVGMSSIQANLY